MRDNSIQNHFPMRLACIDRMQRDSKKRVPLRYHFLKNLKCETYHFILQISYLLQ